MQQRIAIALGTLLALAAIRAHADGTGWATTTLTYDGAAIGNLDGGAARSSTYVGNAHLRSLLDLDGALGWTGTHAYVDALWIHGGQPGAFVGDEFEKVSGTISGRQQASSNCPRSRVSVKTGPSRSGNPPTFN